MQVFRLEKKRLMPFLRKVMRSYELVAPVKTDLVRFEKIKNPKSICFEKPYFPVKGFFFKKHQVLFEFDGSRVKIPANNEPERVFFGLKKCDLNAIIRQDKVFLEDAEDPYYKASREKSFLLGFHCDEACSEYCFCGSMELVDFYDLMFYDKGNHFLVEEGSEKGRFLISKFKEFFKPVPRKITQEEKEIKGTDRLKKNSITHLYDHPGWQKDVENCFSCGACTALCPTCYCFEIHDEVKSSCLSKGCRKRCWSSCQLQSFTRVAGDHVFREKREERFKHRIFHQLGYFKEKYGMNLCVGCGRCIEGCPTRIDFIKTINEMEDEQRE
ncbi:hypothetical protein D6745_04975 [Candidatus Woesearchaeota archaeon]|nr:MAG: hypothetical protein D6745_04975 [Candidatus Woesearchaeota archaeon]